MSFYFRLHIIILLLLLGIPKVQAQDYLYHTEKFSVEEGLSNRFVYSITQDQQGFMWFGTKYGLNRYDGYNFRTMTQEKDKLQSNLIRHVSTDANGYLWVGYYTNTMVRRYYGGIDIINPKTFQIQRLEDFLGRNLPIPIKDIHNMYSVNDQLYLATINGEIYIYQGNKTLQLLYRDPLKGRINNIHLGKQYNWIHAGHRLIATTKKWEIIDTIEVTLRPDDFVDFSLENTPHSIQLELNNLYDLNTFLTWNLSTRELIYSDTLDWLQNLPDGKVRNVLLPQKNKKNFIFKSKKAFVLMDSLHHPLYTYTIPHDKRSNISDFFQDRQGNIWLAVSPKGVFKISIQENKFETILEGYSGRGIIGIKQDSFLIYNSYADYQIKYNTITKESQFLGKHGISMSNSIDGKSIWMSGGGLFNQVTKINKSNLSDRTIFLEEKEVHLDSSNQFVRNGLSWAIYQDSVGVVWIGRSNGLNYLSPYDTLIQTFNQYGQFPSLSHSIINFIQECSRGLWIASSTGLYLLDNKKTGKVIQHIPLPHEHILHVHLETENILWLSTKGGGIIRLDLKDNSVKQYTKQQGLPHNIVYTIQKDNYGYLWMTTDYGLARYDRQTGLFRVFQPSDGIPHEEFNHTSFYKAANGKLYFGGINGIVGLDPKDFLIDDTHSNPIQIVRYQYFSTQLGKLIDHTQDLLQKKEITLTHTDKFFILEFSPLDFVGNRNTRYTYKIEGLDQDWIYFNSNKLRINNLSAGQYTLLIKESNYTDSNAKILRIPIRVKQPFYLTGIFWLLTTLVGLLILLIYAKWRETKLNQQKLLLEQKVEERTGIIAKQAKELKEIDQVKSRFFANISHELRTPLTLMIGPISAILEKHYGEDWNKITTTLSMVQRNGIKLQGLIEEILLLSKLDAKKIPVTLEPTLLFSFVQSILAQFEPQAEIKGIVLRLDYQLDPQLKLELDTNKLEKIITNLLSNALKHTPTNGHIFLQTQKITHQEGVRLQIRLKDEGSGIPPKDLPYIFDRFYQSDHNKTSGAGTGIGLSLVSELTALLDGTIEVSSTLETGTTFVLKLPFIASPTTTYTTTTLEETSTAPSNLPLIPTNATVLIVEDNTDMINFLVDLLHHSYTIHTAANGQIALDWLHQTNQLPDLILSDVMMPILDGIELLSAIKKEKEWFNIPVILLTARANEQDKINALRIGVDDYLKKPFSSQELSARVANLIANYRQRLLFQTEEAQETISIEIPSSVTTPIPDTIDSWLQQIEEILRNQVGNTQFGILELAADLHLSERQLRRKIKTKTGLTPNQYFRAIKLDTARQFLEQKKYETVAEIAHKVGFSNTHYFSQIYQTQYGKKPIDYLKT